MYHLDFVKVFFFLPQNKLSLNVHHGSKTCTTGLVGLQNKKTNIFISICVSTTREIQSVLNVPALFLSPPVNSHINQMCENSF